LGNTRQNDPELGEFARLSIDLNRPAMVLDDDVVTNGEAKPSPFPPAGLVVRNGLNTLSLIATITQNTTSVAPSIIEGFSANGRFPASLLNNRPKQTVRYPDQPASNCQANR
jgi:hypothetical protein